MYIKNQSYDWFLIYPFVYMEVFGAKVLQKVSAFFIAFAD